MLDVGSTDGITRWLGVATPAQESLRTLANLDIARIPAMPPTAHHRRLRLQGGLGGVVTWFAGRRARGHEAAEPGPRNPGLLAHHQFQEAGENGARAQSEQGKLSREYELAELIEVALGVKKKVHAIENKADAAEPSQAAQNHPGDERRVHAVAPRGRAELHNRVIWSGAEAAPDRVAGQAIRRIILRFIAVNVPASS